MKYPAQLGFGRSTHHIDEEEELQFEEDDDDSEIDDEGELEIYSSKMISIVL